MMKELSLHILDIAQNSISAGCTRLELSLTEGDGQLTLVIGDNGRGMTPDQLAHILDPKESDEGSSKIGVYNVHERLQMYFGSQFGLKFFSEPDRGTTAMLILPRLTEETEEPDHALS